jgi:branched-chain amino acid transport system ATP-binding protein
MATDTEGALLEIDGLSKHFGGLRALDDVHITCRRGETLGIIGPNGAGKTTVFNVVTGFSRPTSGTILFKGNAITQKTAAQICRLGIARTFQGVRLFREMTVWENVWLGQNCQAGYLNPLFWSRGVDEAALRADIESLLDEFQILAKKDAKARELAFGDMRRLEICRALATKPDLLLLDEPASGLTPVETGRLIDDLRKLSAAGTTVVLIEHDMNVALGLSDRVVVLNFGQLLAEGTPTEIRQNPHVIEAYLGKSAEAVNA